ncbi:MAG: ParB/RepB/Spo0J family partition protein [bacterium]
MPDNQSQWSNPRGRRGGLGRGLGALIPGAKAQEERRAEVPVARLRANPFQPRQTIHPAELEALVDSIRRHGVLQPIMVRPVADGYEVVAGERRWKAAQAAGLDAVPAVIRSMTDREALELALVENLQREDLNPVERSRAYQKLTGEFGLTQEQVAERVGKSQPSVANALRLLGLPPQVLTSLEAGRITEGHAKAILGLPDEAARTRLWERVERRGLSVRETEELARSGIPRGILRSRQDPELAGIAQDLSRTYAIKVTVEGSRRRGSLRLHYFSEEDLQRLLDLLRVQRQ